MQLRHHQVKIARLQSLPQLFFGREYLVLILRRPPRSDSGSHGKRCSVTENKIIRILVAEDDRSVLQTVSMMLKASGYDVTTAADTLHLLSTRGFLHH